MARYKAGIIGSGGWASAYGRSLRDSDLIELAAVAGGRRVAKFGETFGVRIEESPAALCAARDLDLVIIATPHARHAEQAIMAARGGKHVLVEKPMATSVRDCDRMIRAAEKNRVKLMVAHSRRRFPLVQQAKELVEGGELGEILMLRATFCHDARGIYGKPESNHWLTDPEVALGFLLGYGCHQLDMIWWLIGSRVETVFARFAPYWTEHKLENCGQMMMLFENGCHATFWELTSQPDALNEWPPFPNMQESNEIVGSAALMELRPYERLSVRRQDGWELLRELPPREADPVQVFLREEVEALMRAAEADTDPPVTGEQGKHTVAICLAAYESSRTGRAVQI